MATFLNVGKMQSSLIMASFFSKRLVFIRESYIPTRGVKEKKRRKRALKSTFKEHLLEFIKLQREEIV